jgi:hypothetical protein
MDRDQTIIVKKFFDQSIFRERCTPPFSFLSDLGFAGPYGDDYQLLYVSDQHSVEVHFDDADGRVVTIIEGTAGHRNPRAGLICLYVAAGLGPAQHIREIGRTSSTLDSALESQAAALRRLLPILEGADGGPLLVQCNGQ